MFSAELILLFVIAVGILVLMALFSGGGTQSARRSIGNGGHGIGAGRQAYKKWDR